MGERAARVCPMSNGGSGNKIKRTRNVTNQVRTYTVIN